MVNKGIVRKLNRETFMVNKGAFKLKKRQSWIRDLLNGKDSYIHSNKSHIPFITSVLAVVSLGKSKLLWSSQFFPVLFFGSGGGPGLE